MRLPPHSGLENAKRRIERRVSHIVLAGCLALTTFWAAGTSYYLIFHDEMLARFVSQQSAMQHRYEEKLSALRLALEQSANDRMAAAGTLESRLAGITERQAQIEKRHSVLSGLTGMPADIAAPEPSADASVERAPRPTPTPSPTLELRFQGGDRTEIPGRLGGVESRIAAMSDAQTRAVEEIGRRARQSADRYRQLIRQAGIEPGRFRRIPETTGGLGGPLVPFEADPYSDAAARTKLQINEETLWRRAVATLPLRKPLAGDAPQSSGFGARVDPFTRGYAMHTGVDFRAGTGAPARATAPGRIVTAEYTGGYGNLIEIDHGHGLVTRYGHLSGYAVTEGQRVEAGQVVGYVGSTGRSTGSHLHYETRIDGEAVDPSSFLRAGSQLEFPD